MNTLRLGAMLLLAATTMFACSGDDDDDTTPANVAGSSGDSGAGGAPATAALEIIGEYDDSFMGEQIITADDWNGAAIVGYDNDENVVYTQLPDDDMFNPSKFTKTVYTEPKNGSFYFCQVEFSLDSLAEAKASEATADDSDPENSGCGGTFPWTKATPK